MKLAPSILAISAALVLFGTRAAELSAQTPGDAGVRVDSLRVIGNSRQATPVILSDLGIRTGDVVTSRNIQRGIHRLFGTGQYSDIRVYAAEVAGGGTVLIVEVEERPFIRGYDFRGLQHTAASAARDSAGLERNSALDPAGVFQTQLLLIEALAKKGYVRAQIDTALIATDREGEYRLVFMIDEGRRMVVAAMEFEGNEALSDADLIGGMQVKPEGFLWWKTGEFREEDYRSDIEFSLKQRYGESGYLDFKVLGDSMVVDQKTGKTRLIINVEEGPQYLIGDFKIEGNDQYATALLATQFNPRARSLLSRLPLIGGGDSDREPVFNTGAWRDATDQIRQLYTNGGYLYAQVNPIVERLPEDAEDGSPRVRLIWQIEEGNQAYFNIVAIEGNTNTHERIIRDRVLVLPGDTYGQDRIINSFQTIQGLGFFEPLPPQEALEVSPNQKGDINVTFRVKEKQTGNINFGASLSPAAGVAGFIGYEQPNLFGQAKVGRFRWVFGSRSNDIEIAYTDPSIFGSRKAAGISLRNSRDRLSFVNLGNRRQVGGSVFLGMPSFGSRWTRLTIRYSLFRDEFDDDSVDELDFEQRQLLSVGTRSSITFGLVRDTRNHPLFATSGSRNSVLLEFTGGALGGDGKYRKLEFESDWNTPIARLRSDPTQTPIDLMMGISVRGGAIFGDNPFFLERFFMGGVQAGIPLRGYEELTITPIGHVPTEQPSFSRLDRVGESFFLMSTRIGLLLSGSFFVNVFYDAGNVWRSSFGLNPTDLLSAAGMGVTIVTPVGPLGLDYAYAFDRRDIFGRPNPGWKLHFRFGQIF